MPPRPAAIIALPTACDTKKGARQIDVDRLVPEVERQFFRRREECDARAVDEDVDAAERGQNAVDRLPYRGRIGNVASERRRAAAERLRFGLGRGSVEVDDCDPRPLGGEGVADRRADAGRAAGHQRAFSFQREIEID